MSLKLASQHMTRQEIYMTAEAHSGDKPVRTRLDPAARKAQLLDHAVSAFATSGIERAVHADVAARAGVSTPTVFKYYPTRDALVDAVLDRIETRTMDLFSKIPEDAGLSAFEMTQSLAKAVEHLCQTEPDLMKVGLAWSVAFSSVRERYLAFQNMQLDMLQARISRAEADRSDARIMLGAALLFIRMQYDGTSEDVRQRYVNRMGEIWESAPAGK